MSNTNCAECKTPQPAASLYCEKCGEALFVGKEAGVYRILSQIGAGGMGSVYKGEHTKLGTPFAIKMLHKQLAANEELVTRFVNEAKATSRLRHEHIIFITDFGEFPGFGPYIAMEFLEGSPLKDHLTPGLPFPFERAMTIARQLADTMAYAHSQGIVHRDLKPDNIFLLERAHSSSDYIKVLDFGIAKVLEGLDETSLTKTGAVLGTPIYMSPEQALGKSLDHRSDIFSFGIILFELLTGHLPYQGTTAFELIEARVFRDAPKLSKHIPERGGTPLETLVDLCLKKEPDQRISSMGSIREKLQQILEFERSTGSSSSSLEETGWAPMLDATELSPEATHAPRDLPTPIQPDEEPHTPAPAPYGLPTGIETSGFHYDSQPPTGGRSLSMVVVFVVAFSAMAASGVGTWFYFRKSPKPTKRQVQAPRPLISAQQPRAKQAPTPAKALVKKKAPPQPKKLKKAPKPRGKRRRRRRRWRRAKKRVVQKRVVRPRPVQKRVLRPRPRPRPRRAANGCLENRDGKTYIRLRLRNRGRFTAKIARNETSAYSNQGRLLPSERGGGWCIPVIAPFVWVVIHDPNGEYAHCYFKLSPLKLPIYKLTLKSISDESASGYCFK